MRLTDYEVLLDKANSYGLIVMERPFVFYDGLIKNRKIGIRKSIPTSAQKADVLAEEISHYKYNTGNILDQSVTENRKQENVARRHAYDERFGLPGIIRAYNAKCRTKYEISEYLGVTEEFLEEAIDCYIRRYGESVEHDGYVITFIPWIKVEKKGE